mmetsp:Transcript_42274/g.113068  ORF Transcript_42274/g.113068 Transcript_42274/m.113068 type:complete len:140 (-) Transcript_42274:343-762(-)
MGSARLVCSFVILAEIIHMGSTNGFQKGADGKDDSTSDTDFSGGPDSAVVTVDERANDIWKLLSKDVNLTRIKELSLPSPDLGQWRDNPVFELQVGETKQDMRNRIRSCAPKEFNEDFFTYRFYEHFWPAYKKAKVPVL